MKTFILTDSHGRIIAIGRPSRTGKGESKGRQGRTQISPRSDHILHQVEAPPELTDMPLVELYRRGHVDLSQGEPRLIVKK
jgi:hypothetical protein